MERCTRSTFDGTRTPAPENSDSWRTFSADISLLPLGSRSHNCTMIKIIVQRNGTMDNGQVAETMRSQT